MLMLTPGARCCEEPALHTPLRPGLCLPLPHVLPDDNKLLALLALAKLRESWLRQEHPRLAGLTCAVKKAGVRDPEGSAGLLRAMEPISVLDRTIGGAEISKPLGFLAFGGRDGDFALEPEERFSGSRESESWQLDSRKRLLCSAGRGEVGDRDGDLEEDDDGDEMLALFGSIKEEILADTGELRKAEAAAVSEVEGNDTMGLITCLSVLFVTNLMTVRTSSTGVFPSDFSSSFSVLIGL